MILCGAIASYNATTPPPGPRRYMSLLVNRARMQGFLVFDYPEKDAAAIASLAAMAAEGSLVSRETVVDGSVADFGATFLRLFRGENTGKLVLGIAEIS